jgi:hypothetical protein
VYGRGGPIASPCTFNTIPILDELDAYELQENITMWHYLTTSTKEGQKMYIIIVSRVQLIKLQHTQHLVAKDKTSRFSFTLLLKVKK